MERTTTGKEHFLALDGLRGVAAAAVVLGHASAWFLSANPLPHSFLAVDFFFVLSGFVIEYAYGIPLRTHLSFLSFVRIRAIRLYPLVMLGALIGTSYWIVHGFVAQDSHTTPLQALLQLPFAVFSLPSPSNIAFIPFQTNEPTWSLFFEILINLVFAVSIRWLNVKSLSLIAVCSFCGLCAVVAAHGDLTVGPQYETLLPGTLRVAVPFSLGVLISRMRSDGMLPSLRTPYLLLAGVLIATFLVPEAGQANGVIELFITVVIYPLIVALGCQSDGPNLSSFKQISGKLSYPLYIIHSPLLLWFGTVFKLLYLPAAFGLSAFIAFSLFAAWLAANYFDGPIQALLRKHWLYKRDPEKPAMGAA